MNARRPIFNHLVAPLAGGPVMHHEARQMLDAYRAEVLREAADAIEARRTKEDNKERDQFGSLDHESVLQTDAVHDAADLLRDMAAARPVTAGGLLAAMTRPEACAARSTTRLACTLPGGHDGAHEHHAADSDATTRWNGWSQ